MRILTLAAAACLTCAPVLAQEAAEPPAQVQSQGIEAVIGAQLDAFRGRDVGAAWQYASPMIQRLFGGPGNFGRMVEKGYPMVWDNSSARFVATRTEGGRTYQQVMIQDATGRLHMLEYAMIPEGDSWLIDGVQLLPLPDVGV
ncbi:DUF4864 domain-containing protein [Salipiger sp. IMCC34102]|uniref:DUF4864 domain-containing protein n=1 Tax=Salipiger sp. IMCC34102 TaxID=2510647 RepID=UPI00101B8A2E|nr:DUF4864 domain-containing protein [Salipiger sp. IMCC34102]RYH02164.1 DUF4864 domain-containing protein [Salipiger sp. IMCC34102]